MHHFYIDTPIFRDGVTSFEIPKELKHQINNVVRIGINESIVLINNNTKYLCKIVNNNFELLEVITNDLTNNFKLTLVQSIPKSSKPEFIVQKATELGADSIVFYQAKRSISKIDEKSFISKQQRYIKIATEATEQSRRFNVPSISYISNLGELHSEDTMKLVANENEESLNLSDVVIPNTIKEIQILIGPEGGFDTGEIEG
ncbi:MAG: hypothetical protein DRP42_05620 [Tenericutes bacterium]|nr:MAG: hypothetical protein DRP42_05620 [Mycoplasmatota bacterium]